VNKPVPNLKSTQTQLEKVLLSLQTWFGAKGKDSGSLECLPSIITKLQELEVILKRIATPSKDNISPHTLD